MTRWSSKRGVAAAIFAVACAVEACGDPPAVRRDDLALGEDDASGKSKKSGPGGDSPEGTTTGSVELGTGTRGTEPGGAEGDEATAKDAPDACTTDAQCNLAGRICTAGACVKGCNATTACPTNQLCQQGQCSFDDANVECYADYDCDYGTICVTDKCIAGCYTSGDCPTGQTCAAGQCKVASTTTTGTTPTTPTCVSDGQCNPGINGAGLICSAQGACVPGCHRDNQCPGSKICVTGACK